MNEGCLLYSHQQTLLPQLLTHPELLLTRSLSMLGYPIPRQTPGRRHRRKRPRARQAYGRTQIVHMTEPNCNACDHDRGEPWN